MSSIILKSLIAATVVTFAAPVLAAPSGSQPTTVLRYDAKAQKYCTMESAITGSRIKQKTCKTIPEWTAAGLDMPNAARVVSAQRSEMLIAQK